ncbi:MAG: 50S ribosomal protein L30 [Nitrososphaerales archaeon]
MSSSASTVTKRAEQEQASGSLLVVNMRGLVNTRTPVLTTLTQLSIARRFNATIVLDNKVYRGMLHLAKEHVAWCKLDNVTAEKLLRSRSEKSTGVKISESELKANNKSYSSFANLASDLESGKVKLGSVSGLRPFFRLSPPRGGFKRSTRRQYRQGGILGQNEELSKLLEKML